MATPPIIALASNPYWYFVDLSGKPAGSGNVYFYSSLNPNVPKTVYQDPNGVLAYPQPIPISLNGTIGPIYFSINTTDPKDNYNIWAYAANGDLIEQINNFNASTGGSGGGGGGSSFLNLENLVTNNVFYRNVGSVTPAAGVTLLAPGVHQGLANTTTSPQYCPDVTFYKNNGSGTDSITFPAFSFGTTTFAPNDTTPYDYFNYSCSVPGTGEVKYVTFPLTNHVGNIANQSIAGTIWAICNSGDTGLILTISQFFGDGSSASATVNNPIASLTLTSSWAQYTFTATIPPITGTTPGQCGNDGVFLQIAPAANTTTNIGFTKPTLYLSTTAPTLNYFSYDEISGIVEAPRTGDMRVALNSFGFGNGWVLMNDGVIGNAGATPPTILTNRLNIDTFPLYNLLWNTFSGTQAYAPMFSRTTGLTISYGASSIADWSAGNVIQLTYQAGRLLGAVGIPSSGNNTGTTWAIGQFTGSEQTNQVATHGHSVNISGFSAAVNITGDTTTNFGVGPSVAFSNGATPRNQVFNVPFTGLPIVNAAGISEVNIQNPVTYQNIYMKL